MRVFGSDNRLSNSQIRFGGTGSRFRIEPNAVMEMRAAVRTTAFNSVGAGAIDALVANAGTLRKTGSLTSYFGGPVNFVNFGRLRIEEGELEVSSSLTNHGVIELPEGSTLTMDDFMHGETARLLGNGTLDLFDGDFRGDSEFAGLMKVRGTANFARSVRSTGSWLITGTATFNGSDTSIAGPVTSRGGRLIFNSPAETIVPDLRWEEDPQQGNNNVIGGSGSLVYREDHILDHSLSLVDSFTLRFERSVEIRTNLSVNPPAVVEFNGPVRWVGGSIGGRFRLLPGGLFEMIVESNATRSISSPSRNVATLRKTGPGTVYLNPLGTVFFTNVSNVEVLAGALILNAGTSNVSYWQQEGGITRVDDRLSAEGFDFQAGLLTGNGRLSVGSSINVYGCKLACTVSPGDTIGTLRFDGEGSSPIWLPGSRTIIDIGGLNPGLNHDQIIAERTLNIDAGILEVRLVAGYVPEIGQEFVILTGSGRTGTFTEVTGLETGQGRRLRVIYESAAVKLRVETAP